MLLKRVFDFYTSVKSFKKVNLDSVIAKNYNRKKKKKDIKI